MRAQAPEPHDPHTYMKSAEYMRQGFPAYTLPGNYSPQQESNQQIKGYIDNIGNDVMSERLYGVGNNFTLDCDVTKFYCWPIFSEGCPSYRISRHDWT